MPSRYANVDEYYAELGPEKSDLIKRIYATVTADFPALKIKIAWNQPVLYLGGRELADSLGVKKALSDKYVAGMSAASNWLLYNPFSPTILQDFASRLTDYHTGSRTIRIMPDWQIDAKLLHDLTAARLTEIDRELTAKLV